MDNTNIGAVAKADNIADVDAALKRGDRETTAGGAGERQEAASAEAAAGSKASSDSGCRARGERLRVGTHFSAAAGHFPLSSTPAGSASISTTAAVCRPRWGRTSGASGSSTSIPETSCFKRPRISAAGRCAARKNTMCDSGSRRGKPKNSFSPMITTPRAGRC